MAGFPQRAFPVMPSLPAILVQTVRNATVQAIGMQLSIIQTLAAMEVVSITMALPAPIAIPEEIILLTTVANAMTATTPVTRIMSIKIKISRPEKIG